MAPRKPTQPVVSRPEHNAKSLRLALDRLQSVLREVEDFDLQKIGTSSDGALSALRANISRAVEKAFGENTSDAIRFGRAANIQGYHVLIMGRELSDAEYRSNVAEDMATTIPLLESAIRAVEEDLAAMDDDAVPPGVSAAPVRAIAKDKVFIVHGHDEAVRESVARFLEMSGITAIILHEQANAGRTIIEKIEAFSDVGFAIVLLTPDDIGGKIGEPQKPRARQNVLLELGYFMAKLGRSNVAAFVKDEVDIPTDFAGVAWQPLNAGWRQALGLELQAAGYRVDWQRIMGGS